MKNLFIPKAYAMFLKKGSDKTSFTLPVFDLSKWFKKELNRNKVSFTADCIDCPNEASIVGTVETVGSGAINTTGRVSNIVTTGAATGTLANGSQNQEKVIYMKTDGGDFVLTPANLAGGTTITFNDAGDFIKLIFLDGKWRILSNSGTTVA